MTINYDGNEPTVSARELHKSLEISKRFSAWFETNSQGFVENEDFTSVLSGTVVNNGAHREIQDYLWTEKGAFLHAKSLNTGKAWEVYDRLVDEYFEKGSRKPMTVAEQIQLLALGNQDHEERIEKLENTMTIDYGQQKYISDLVSKVVIEVLGGKKSNAYDEIGKKVFAECNRDVKTYFDVNARNNIPKLRYQEAVEYIKGWTPCTNTKMMIRDCNAQMTM